MWGVVGGERWRELANRENGNRDIACQKFGAIKVGTRNSIGNAVHFALDM